MFELFTDDARRVIVLAQYEAGEMGHDRIGTEHLLLGAVRVGQENDQDYAPLLAIGPDDVRSWIRDTIGFADAQQRRHRPFTARAKKALEAAGEWARTRHHTTITPTHLLAGLAALEASTAHALLVDADLEVAGLLAALKELLAAKPPA